MVHCVWSDVFLICRFVMVFYFRVSGEMRCFVFFARLYEWIGFFFFLFLVGCDEYVGDWLRG